MKVECIHCGATGQMDETKIPAGVRTIKCPKCQQSFPIPAVAMANATTPDANTAPPRPQQPPPLPDPPIQPPPPDPGMQPPQSPPVTTTACTVCSGQFPRSEMVRFGTSWVCADCKPGYVQMMAQGVARPGNMRYAGFWIRFGAKFLDGLILGIVNLIVRTVLVVPFAINSPKAVIITSLLASVLQLVITGCYSGYFLSKHRATPGKMACGLAVVTPEGDSISFWRGVGRPFAEIISSMILLIGYLMVCFDDEKRALHDRICNTRVVYK